VKGYDTAVRQELEDAEMKVEQCKVNCWLCVSVYVYVYVSVCLCMCQCVLVTDSFFSYS